MAPNCDARTAAGSPLDGPGRQGGPWGPRKSPATRGGRGAIIAPPCSGGLTVKQASTLNCSGPPKSPARDGKNSTRGRRAGAGAPGLCAPDNQPQAEPGRSISESTRQLCHRKQTGTDGEHTTDAGRSIPPAGGGGAVLGRYQNGLNRVRGGDFQVWDRILCAGMLDVALIHANVSRL